MKRKKSVASFKSVGFCLGVSLLALTGVLAACETTPKRQDVRESVEDQQMRHGWTVFSGPQRTILDVNDEDSIRRGAKVYQQHCMLCHGQGGRGDGPLAKAMGIQPTSLAAISKTLPNHYLVIQINRGKGDMPHWEDLLSSRETWDLTNYIQSLQNN